MAVRLNGPKADGKAYAFNFEFTDTRQNYELTLENCVLNYFPDRSNPAPTATLKLATLDFKLLMLQIKDAATLMGEGKLEIDGEALAFAELAGLFDRFSPRWPIVTPRPAWS